MSVYSVPEGVGAGVVVAEAVGVPSRLATTERCRSRSSMAAATVVSPRISPQDADAAVGGQDDGGLQVALGDDLEQGGGGFGGQREVAQFVDDQEAGSGEEAHGGGPASFDGGAVAAGGEVGGGGEVGAVAGLGGVAGQADGEVGLADAGRADEQDVGGGSR